MNIHKPLVSFLIAVFNGQDKIVSTVSSAINQNYKNIQIVIVDDCSTDKTAEVLVCLSKVYKKKIFVISNKENLGLTKSLNVGIKACSGKYIARLDCGDYAYPNRIDKQLQIFLKNPKVKLVGSSANVINANGYFSMSAMDNNNLSNCLMFNPFAHSTAMFSKNSVIRLGCYNESFDTSQDFELWMRFYKNYQVRTIKEPLVDWIWCSDGISERKKIRQILNSFRARIIHNQPTKYYLVTYHTIRQILLSYLPRYVYKKIKGI
jgi:glycosyltransferase involved in cell wall biosynthesis